MKALAWMLPAVAGTALAQQAEDSQIEVKGKLVDDSALATDVPLAFDCQAGAQVALSLSAGMAPVLLTNRASLGLQVQLRDKTDKTGISVGETGTWPVEDEPLALTLRLKPWSVGELPEAGSYTFTLLMQITYR